MARDQNCWLGRPEAAIAASFSAPTTSTRPPLPASADRGSGNSAIYRPKLSHCAASSLLMLDLAHVGERQAKASIGGLVRARQGSQRFEQRRTAGRSHVDRQGADQGKENRSKPTASSRQATRRDRGGRSMGHGGLYLAAFRADATRGLARRRRLGVRRCGHGHSPATPPRPSRHLDAFIVELNRVSGRRHPAAVPRRAMTCRTRAARLGFDPVTAADKGAEAAIRDLDLETTIPHHGVIGEEYGEDRPDAEYRLGARPYRRHPRLHRRPARVDDPDRTSLIVDIRCWARSASHYIGEIFVGHAGGARLIDRAGERPLKIRTGVPLSRGDHRQHRSGLHAHPGRARGLASRPCQRPPSAPRLRRLRLRHGRRRRPRPRHRGRPEELGHRSRRPTAGRRRRPRHRLDSAPPSAATAAVSWSASNETLLAEVVPAPGGGRRLDARKN